MSTGFVSVVVSQYDIDPRASIAVEDYTSDDDCGIIFTFADELALYVDDETAERLLRALLSEAPRLSVTCMQRLRDILAVRIHEHAASHMGQRQRLDPGPLP